MAGYDNADPISGNFLEQAGTIVLEVNNMEIDGSKVTFELEDAMSKADALEDAQRIVVVEDKAAFLKDPSSCVHVTVGEDSLSKESFNLWSGTATVGVSGLDASEANQAVEHGCAVADIERTSAVQVASLN